MTSPAAMLKGLQFLQQAQALYAAGKPAEAAALFARAHALIPDHPQLLLSYGTLAEEVQDWAAAEKLYRRLGVLRPQSNFEGKLGLCLFRLERYSEAIDLFLTHLRRHPDDPAIRMRLGQAYCMEKRWDDALAVGRPLLAAHFGEASLEIVLNSLFNLGRQAEMDALLEQALQLQPASSYIQALCGLHLLKSFDNRRGFQYQQAMRKRYEGRKSTHERLAADGWDGKPFDGVLLIEGEQGIGEEILGASMFSELLAIGQQAVISCEPRLLPLFRRSFPGLTFVSRHGDELDQITASGIRHHRFQSIDLGCVFRRTENFPSQQPWLIPDAARVAVLQERFRKELSGQRLAGISWKSKREYTGGPDKNIALAQLAPLLQLPDFTWFNLQYGDTSSDLAAIAALGIEVPRSEDDIDVTQDIDGLAALISVLDCVVSTSNTTAHLAGALGICTHLLLPQSRPVLWYWGYAGDTTPWYPAVRIHRNTDENDWGDLVAQLKSVLGESR